MPNLFQAFVASLGTAFLAIQTYYLAPAVSNYLGHLSPSTYFYTLDAPSVSLPETPAATLTVTAYWPYDTDDSTTLSTDHSPLVVTSPDAEVDCGFGSLGEPGTCEYIHHNVTDLIVAEARTYHGSIHWLYYILPVLVVVLSSIIYTITPLLSFRRKVDMFVIVSRTGNSGLAFEHGLRMKPRRAIRGLITWHWPKLLLPQKNATAYSGYISRLERDLERANVDLASSRKSVEQQAAKISQLRKDHDTKSRELDKLEHSARMEPKQIKWIQDLHNDLHQRDKEIRRLKRELKFGRPLEISYSQKRVRTLEEILKGKDEESHQAIAEISNLQAQLSTKTQQIESLEAGLKQAEPRPVTVLDSKQSEKITGLEQSIGEKDARISGHKKTIRKLKTANVKLQQVVKKSRKASCRRGATISKLTAEKQNLQQDVKKAHDVAANNEASIDELTAKNNKLERELHAALAENTKLNHTHAQDAKHKAESASAEKAALIKEIRVKQDTIDQLESHKKILMEGNERLHKEITTTRDSAGKQQLVNDDLFSKNKSLQEEVEARDGQIANLCAALEERANNTKQQPKLSKVPRSAKRPSSLCRAYGTNKPHNKVARRCKQGRGVYSFAKVSRERQKEEYKSALQVSYQRIIALEANLQAVDHEKNALETSLQAERQAKIQIEKSAQASSKCVETLEAKRLADESRQKELEKELKESKSELHTLRREIESAQKYLLGFQTEFQQQDPGFQLKIGKTLSMSRLAVQFAAKHCELKMSSTLVSKLVDFLTDFYSLTPYAPNPEARAPDWVAEIQNSMWVQDWQSMGESTVETALLRAQKFGKEMDYYAAKLEETSDLLKTPVDQNFWENEGNGLFSGSGSEPDQPAMGSAGCQSGGPVIGTGFDQVQGFAAPMGYGTTQGCQHLMIGNMNVTCQRGLCGHECCKSTIDQAGQNSMHPAGLNQQQMQPYSTNIGPTADENGFNGCIDPQLLDASGTAGISQIPQTPGQTLATTEAPLTAAQFDGCIDPQLLNASGTAGLSQVPQTPGPTLADTEAPLTPAPVGALLASINASTDGQSMQPSDQNVFSPATINTNFGPAIPGLFTTPPVNGTKAATPARRMAIPKSQRARFSKAKTHVAANDGVGMDTDLPESSTQPSAPQEDGTEPMHGAEPADNPGYDNNSNSLNDSATMSDTGPTDGSGTKGGSDDVDDANTSNGSDTMNGSGPTGGSAPSEHSSIDRDEDDDGVANDDVPPCFEGHGSYDTTKYGMCPKCVPEHEAIAELKHSW